MFIVKCSVGGSSTRGSSSKTPATDKQKSVEDKVEETPKRDARKRTRHSLQSPATDSALANKRQRRT